jgi:hypothetical protein
MRMHFASRLSLLLIAGFGVVATQVWAGKTLEWLFIAIGALTILISAADASVANKIQRGFDGVMALLGAWTIVAAVVFTGSTLKWVSFTDACALAVLATAGLLIHEMSTERVVHELSVTTTDRLRARSA